MATRKSKTAAKTPRARKPRAAAGGNDGGNIVIPREAQPPRDFHALSRKERNARADELRGIIAERQLRARLLAPSKETAEARTERLADKIARLREITQLRSFTYDAEYHALLADLETEHGIERTADDVATAIAPEVELQQLEGIPADHDPVAKRK